ncbi:MAG TPA: hypothetical protein VFY29_06945 [Terriglobia bacterium]|nr:hypothetical protein [Terriglobia bacterium]
MIRFIQQTFFRKPWVLVAAGILVLAAAQGSMSAPGQAGAAGTPPAGQRLFYASHSLMWDMPPVLQQEAEAYGIKGHAVLGIQRLGVSTTSQHWNLPDNQNQAKQALNTGNVDVFVMSPIALPDEGIDNFVKLGLEHNPKMRFLIQVSWPGLGLTDNNDLNAGTLGGLLGGAGGGPGAAPAAGGRGGAPGAGGPGAGGPGAGRGGAPGGFGGFGGGAGGFGGARGPAPGGAPGGGREFVAQGQGPGGGRGAAPGGFGGFGGGGGGQNYNKTPEELATINIRNDKSAEEQAAKINKELGKQVVFLIPTSKAHNALRLAIYKKEMPGMTDQGEVFADFIGHPTPPVIALNTYVHFAVLYQRSPIGLPMPAVLKNGNRPQWDEKLNRKLQEIAWDIVSHYPPSGVSAGSK